MLISQLKPDSSFLRVSLRGGCLLGFSPWGNPQPLLSAQPPNPEWYLPSSRSDSHLKPSQQPEWLKPAHTCGNRKWPLKLNFRGKKVLYH